jgi:hypothetical protein
MTNPTTQVDGQTVDVPVWALVQDSWKACGLPADGLTIAQGCYKTGNGAAASAGTHDGAGVVDIRTRNITHQQAVDLVVELRRRGLISWFRAPEYGWTKTGEHIHGVYRALRNQGMAPGAQRQLDSYDKGKNGLANNGKDPHPRPVELGWPLPTLPTVVMSDLVVGKSSASAAIVIAGMRRRGTWWKTYLAGNPSGKWTTRTEAALTRYAKKNGLTRREAVRTIAGAVPIL